MRAKGNAAIYRPDLGMVVEEFYEDASTMGFIGLDLMPIVPVDEESASYTVIPKEVMFNLPDTSRAPRGTYNRGDWTYERGNYTTKENGWEEPMDDTERANFDRETKGGLSGVIATKRAMKIVMRNQEKRIADKIFDASTFTPNSITNEWDDATNAVPITDVNTGVVAFRDQCGMLPDGLVINWNVMRNLRSCDQIQNQIQYTFPGLDRNAITAEHLARIFDIPKVYVGGAVYNSAGKGLDASMSNIWSSEYAALIKIGNPSDMMEPGFGFTFLYTGDSPSNAVVEQYREEQRRSDVYRVRHNTDEALLQSKTSAGAVQSNIASACIYLMDNITT